MKKTFNQFVLQFIDEDTPRGDFAVDWKNDSLKPKKVGSWKALKSYLESRNACDVALEEAKNAWELFKLSSKS